MDKFTLVNRDTYNDISKDWDRTRKRPWEHDKLFLDNISNKEEKTLIDVGCGTGRHLVYAQSIGFKTRNLIGTDISTGQLELVQEKGFRAVEAEMKLLPFETASFDIVLCIAAHHHYMKEEERIQTLNELFRILKKDGKCYLTNWNRDSILHLFKEKPDKFLFLDDQKKEGKIRYKTLEGDISWRYYYLYDQHELEEEVKSVGFVIEKSKIAENNIVLELTKESST